jgi:hypothetical protein
MRGGEERKEEEEQCGRGHGQEPPFRESDITYSGHSASRGGMWTVSRCACLHVARVAIMRGIIRSRGHCPFSNSLLLALLS